MSTVDQNTVVDEPTMEQINAAYDAEVAGTPVGDTASKEAPDLAKPDAKEEKPSGELDEGKAEGVLAKDGKTIIPIEVLNTTRQQLADEKAARAADNAKFEAMQAELDAIKEGKASVDTSKFYTDEDLEILAETSPTQAEHIRELQSAVVNVTAKTKQVEVKQQQQFEATIKQQQQDAIDSSPLLTALQLDTDPTGWNQAARIDQMLLADPEFANKPIAERMAETARLYELRYGKHEAKNSKDANKVQEAIDKANKTAPAVKSISDLAGGATPGSEDVEFANQSAPEMADKFANMTPAQMDAYLARTIA